MISNFSPCLITRKIAFFAYLDQRPYVQSYEFAGGSYLQYQIAINNLSSTLPIVVGEMQSLYSMVRNIAHFLRFETNAGATAQAGPL